VNALPKFAVTAGIAIAVLLAARSLRANRATAAFRRAVGAIDEPRLRNLLAQAEAAALAMSAALEPGDSVRDRDDRDARAAAALREMEAAVTASANELAPAFASSLATFVAELASAQVRLMAFAMNRRNHGEAVSAESKAELHAREAFEREVRPLLATLRSASAPFRR